MSILGTSLIGEAAKLVVKRFITGSSGEADLRRAQVELSLVEAQGTLEQKNWRPYVAILLIKIVAIYLLMPIVAESFYLITGTWFKSVPKFPWLAIWKETGIPLFTLATSFLGIYTGGRTWEKKTGVGGEGIGGKIKEMITGNRKATNQPQVIRSDQPIKPISDIQSFAPPVNHYKPIDGAQLRREILKDESRVDAVYLDHLGNKTAGIGHLLTPEDPEYQFKPGTLVKKARVNEWFKNDIRKAVSSAKRVVPQYKGLPHEARLVFANMAFQMGGQGLSRFKKTLEYVALGEWKNASEEMLDSKWFEQTPKRALRLSARLAKLEGSEFA